SDDVLRILSRQSTKAHIGIRSCYDACPGFAFLAVRQARRANSCADRGRTVRLLIRMNLRGHAPLHHPGIQLAPLVDVLLLLLIFFLLTWNAARTENELDVKVPKASAAREKSAPIGDVVVNVKADGNVVVNRRTLSGPELTELLKSLVQLN